MSDCRRRSIQGTGATISRSFEGGRSHERERGDHMKQALTASLFALTLSLGAVVLGRAEAQTVLRLDEVPVGELDPARASDSADSTLFYNVYDTLLVPGPGGRGFAPNLAETYSGEGNTFTFKLRSGVKFHSGNEVTAEDVVFSLNRLNTIGAGFSPLFKGWVEKVEAVDPR